MNVLIDNTLLEQPSAISYTELAPQTRAIIKQTHSGQAIIVEEHGEDRAILMDPVDYRLLVAMLAYHTSPVEERQVQNGASLFIGLLESTLCGMTKQERWNRVMRAYLNDEISLGRVANLLDISRFQLDKCFQHLNIPRRIGPVDLEDARSEVNVALSTLKKAG